MIRSVTILSALVATSSAFASYNQPYLSCTGTDGDEREETQVEINAFVDSSEVLSKLEYKATLQNVDPCDRSDGPADAETIDEAKLARVQADADYQPRNSKYAGMQRFTLGGGWTNTYLLLPAKLGQKVGYVNAYLQRTGHDPYPTIQLECEVSYH